ncbi:helix-turn-helix domain-containing protein [Niallia taxi]|uniref:XRE family transcriptional regulator n=1 Tax=Niallia taxi TaxID=2499688 RepID=A0A3S3SKG9_9BACI|nr:helix-turn-helix transcriptional regulator [Niallia taxi]RVT62780.1 XRE family transcriptional regulator [Niallia taxi]
MIKVHLSKIMGEQRLNIADVSKLTGLHRNGLAKLYNEDTKGITFDTLEKLCLVLNCKIENLLEIVPDKNEETSEN